MSLQQQIEGLTDAINNRYSENDLRVDAEGHHLLRVALRHWQEVMLRADEAIQAQALTHVLRGSERLSLLVYARERNRQQASYVKWLLGLATRHHLPASVQAAITICYAQMQQREQELGAVPIPTIW